MATGSCFCGKVKIAYEGDPIMQAICHCTDCRKISGSTYSTNIVVPGDKFKVTAGSPKVYTTKADSGNDFNSYFCGDCGSTLYRDGKTFGDNKVVKVGVMDDLSALNKAKPGAELYTKHRVDWVKEVPGSAQKEAM